MVDVHVAKTVTPGLPSGCLALRGLPYLCVAVAKTPILGAPGWMRPLALPGLLYLCAAIAEMGTLGLLSGLLGGVPGVPYLCAAVLLFC
ncbi:hypothetical protein E2C01_097902 [Portunus trituberculatus]|uniref:Uncharacterized protein n=1 Tax=Portunus trituberculatus TaxID=210409 RepID=A0A5B7KCL0_PORTR|nr:hypothetical protein [Portunus trituberculatus]